jgi:hypothetical protein
MLFAMSDSDSLMLFLALAVPVLIVYGLVQWYMLTYHPEEYKEAERRAHELEVARQQAAAAEGARRHERKKQVFGVLGSVLGGVVKKKLGG